jgi:hypothetical protein
MLHNVPVARILGFLYVASVILLAWITCDGFRTSAGTLGPGAHIRFALFGIVIVLFTHTMTLFYFVGTGSRIKKVVRQYVLPASLTERTVRFKARLFPWLTFTPLVTMAAFILGGGAHTHVLPGWVHGSLALLALGMNLVTTVLAVQCISDNVVLIDEIDALLPDTAGE